MHISYTVPCTLWSFLQGENESSERRAFLEGLCKSQSLHIKIFIQFYKGKGFFVIVVVERYLFSLYYCSTVSKLLFSTSLRHAALCFCCEGLLFGPEPHGSLPAWNSPCLWRASRSHANPRNFPILPWYFRIPWKQHTILLVELPPGTFLWLYLKWSDRTNCMVSCLIFITHRGGDFVPSLFQTS